VYYGMRTCRSACTIYPRMYYVCMDSRRLLASFCMLFVGHNPCYARKTFVRAQHTYAYRALPVAVMGICRSATCQQAARNSVFAGVVLLATSQVFSTRASESHTLRTSWTIPCVQTIPAAAKGYISPVPHARVRAQEQTAMECGFRNLAGARGALS
jgi:hypothetical protein